MAGAHRLASATRPAADLLAELAAERAAVGGALSGPISDKLRAMESVGIVGAQLVYHEDDNPGVVVAPRRRWWMRWTRASA
jgi:hypothetical protein